MKIRPLFLLLILFLFFSFFSISAAQNQDEAIIIGKYDKLFSKILDEERILLINLPEGYEESEETYPVLYALDGDVSVLSEIYHITRNIGFHNLAPMIIAAIKNTSRNRDMLPDLETGGSDRFLKFFSEELIPYVEENYRANHFSILYGASNAGVFVIYALLKDPKVFSAYLASSPTLIWSRDYMIDTIHQVINEHSAINRFLYIIYGDKEWKEVRDELNSYIPRLESLKSKGLMLKIEYHPESGHVPLNSLYFGLRSLFDGYQYPDEKRRSEGLDSLKTYYEQFSNKIGYKVKYPFSALNGVGQSLLFRQKKTKEAIQVFELLKENYPWEGSCDIMLAVAYFKDNNLELAEKYYHSALEHEGVEIPPFPEWEEMKKLFK